MSFVINHRINIDLTNPAPVPRIQIKQGDRGTHSVVISLYNNGKEWEVPDEGEPVLRYHVHDLSGGEDVKGVYDTLPDGSQAWAIGDNNVIFRLTDAMTARHSIVLADVVLRGEGKVLSTFSFELYVHRAPVDSAEPDLVDYYRVATLEQINQEFSEFHDLCSRLEARIAALEAAM